jgi:hypothetical protein
MVMPLFASGNRPNQHHRVALLEAEDDPPVGANGDAPIPGKLALQRMQPEAGQVELVRSHRFIEPGEHAGDFIGMLGVDFAAVIVFVKASEAAMSKAPDHPSIIQ